MAIALAGTDAWKAVHIDQNAEVAAGPEYARVFEAAAQARAFAARSNVQDWNQATNMVISGQAGGQIMGDWAQGEFQVAGLVAGEDYSCLPGLGMNEIISTGGCVLFPENQQPRSASRPAGACLVDDFARSAGCLQPEKGSLPVRGDIDLTAANDCMAKGLEILATGNILPDANQTFSPDTQGQIEDLMVEFWNDPSYTAEDAQRLYAEIIARAD